MIYRKPYMEEGKNYICYTKFIIFICFIFLISCVSQEDKDKIKEGEVVYRITYLENNMAKNIPTNLLPSKMTLKFKNDKTILEIEGFMGLFSLKILNDHKKKESTSLLKVIDKKYYYESELDEASFCFKGIPGMKVELRKGMKEIAGLKSKRGRVIFPNSDSDPYIFYYTQQISIKNPNYDNPYSNVDGVMMKFQMKLHKLRMELTASKVKQVKVSNNEFNIPAGFKKVSKTDMEEILATLME